MSVGLSELISIWGQPKIIGTPNSEEFIDRLLLDSRSPLAGPHAVFFAYKGTHHDGHQYLSDLHKVGVKFWVIQNYEAIPDKFDGYVWLAENPVSSLQSLTQFYRKKFIIPVIGITGSNGKTIVKEWLAQLLAGQIPLVKSPKSFNSQTGVPLSVWQINERHQLGIFEAGISKPNEMENLEKVIQPTIGVFTNLGTAHNEGFESMAQKLKEKLKLFINCKDFIYNKNSHYGQMAEALLPDSIRKWGWSIELMTNGQFIWNGLGSSWQGKLTFTDSASLENLGHCIAVCQLLKADKDRVLSAIEHLSYPEMRLTVKHGLNGCVLVDDCYNNDLAGLEIALEFSERQWVAGKKRVAILSEPKETGLDKQELLQQVSSLLQSFQIDALYWLGEYTPQIKGKVYSFKTFQSLYKSLEIEAPHQALVLIKGGRNDHFEGIVSLLQEKLSGLRLEINMEALTFNLNAYRNWVGPNVKLMAMVKALAYGSGGLETAKLMEFQGADYLAVAYPDEGVELRQNGISLPIMVMNAAPETWFKLSQWQLEPVLFSVEGLKSYLQFASDQHNLLPPVHLEVNTGMNRLGFEVTDQSLISELLKLGGNKLKIASVFSHLSASESPEFDYFTQLQIDSFVQFSQDLSKDLGYQPLRHILNSAGIERFPPANFEMVRMGIGLYGVSPVENSLLNLRPIGALKTTVSQIREINPNESVGYGRKGQSPEKRKIATIAIGYADGYSRSLGNGKAYFLINGFKAPTVGSICMDMTMADVTGLDVRVGDEVIVFNHELTVAQLAERWGTIPYEVLTSLGNRVKRVFFAA